MLTAQLHDFLQMTLTQRPIFYPRSVVLSFPDGYEATHLNCYRTARKLEKWKGYPVIAGITFLDKVGKLFPWPHMINARGARLVDGLIDSSPTVDQPNLGFIPIHVDETSAWNDITHAYGIMGADEADGPSWGDPYADALTQAFLPRLRSAASFAHLESIGLAMPDSIPGHEQ